MSFKQKNITIICGILFLVVLMITGHSSCLAAKDIQILFLKAENLEDKEQSILLWHDILSELAGEEENNNNPVISERLVRYNIVNDYMTLFTKEQDMDHLVNALNFIRNFKDSNEQAWSYIYMINIITESVNIISNQKLYNFVSNLIDDTERLALSFNNKDKSSHIFYALSMLLTKTQNDISVFEEENLSLVHGFIKNIERDKHRIHILKQFSRLAKGKDFYPKQYADFYSVMAQDKIEESSLIEIHNYALKEDFFDLAVLSLLSIEKEKQRTKKLFVFFENLFKQKEMSRARRVVKKIENPSKAVNSWSKMAQHYLISGYKMQSDEAYEKALFHAGRIKKSSSREKAYKLIENRKKAAQKKTKKQSSIDDNPERYKREAAIKYIQDRDISNATDIARTIKDSIYRAITFRKIAEIQLSFNDSYNILKNVNNLDKRFYTLPEYDQNMHVSSEIVNAYKQEIYEHLDDDESGLYITKGLSSNIGSFIHKDSLPEKLSYNGDTISTMIPFAKGAEIERSYYEDTFFNGKFYSVYGNAGFSQDQRTSAPEAIIIENGITDISAVYDALKDMGIDDYIIKTGHTYLLRRPLVINNNASLVITGDDVHELRLSSETGTYLVNVGNLFVSDTKITGWDEKKDAPAFAVYADKRKFRPFFTAWSRSKTYIGRTEITALGYGNGKSYGLSFSAGPKKWFKHGNWANINRPTGIITDNSIRNALYGFYSYEADDVALIGNEYVDNIVYGIDPHDRSRRLVIGYNTTYNTYKKHGIIISREVNDTLIMGNVSFDNKGTGIMLDRESNGALVYGNTLFHNKQEGMTVFESDCAIIAANNIFENKGSGFRIRNSYNMGLFYNNIFRNEGSGITAYNGTLKGKPVHKLRDFDLDPYDELTTVSAIGNRIEENGTGINIESIAALYLKGNRFINQSPKIVRGVWFKENPDILFRYNQEKQGLVINRTCPVLPKKLNVQKCKYRENKTLYGDGQDELINRIAQSICAHSIVYESSKHGDMEVFHEK
ncbi:MAG: right-handed parallel beta-helix repeat-containing protein [Alphaproteobacteria bacterium]|nr:right-handed parallel beta-helix repeat-containing protein [Alphaproteobacteria bacterium]